MEHTGLYLDAAISQTEIVSRVPLFLIFQVSETATFTLELCFGLGFVLSFTHKT